MLAHYVEWCRFCRSCCISGEFGCSVGDAVSMSIIILRVLCFVHPWVCGFVCDSACGRMPCLSS